MQTDLFIIGNGFDLGHNMPTSYCNNFRPWILHNYPEAEEDENIWFLEPSKFPDGEERLNDIDAAKFIINCIDDSSQEDWNDFETALGNINWSYFFDALPDSFDKDGDLDVFHMEQVREAFAHSLRINCKCFSRLFSKWINSIKYPKVETFPFLTESKKKESLFLNFNYTKTLEKLYGISPENICHIHGIQGREIIIGHGRIADYHDGIFIDRETDLDWSLFKPTEEIFKNHRLFFDKIQQNKVKDVYSWGFSFSDVDLYYIKQISLILNKEHAKWHLHNFCISDCDKFRKKLRKCGFLGEIDTFKA
ncbi:hypothetical protein FYJ38_21980 [Clostridium sp. WB02_MRS01]|uniref:bacteriophage abortive infection AbiH family protein n=1 Tax=Clostridium sp. WB02_MRS01 TaxID=2605777 RepID=UPI0012B2525D|nr:bacteriophage abortive infection AbiH family protein [Clostridium sp. WB02_MRS01]MSS11291.1 hypothetical protein [Clostridium sp. WB02_MRS01]